VRQKGVGHGWLRHLVATQAMEVLRKGQVLHGERDEPNMGLLDGVQRKWKGVLNGRPVAYGG